MKACVLLLILFIGLIAAYPKRKAEPTPDWYDLNIMAQKRLNKIQLMKWGATKNAFYRMRHPDRGPITDEKPRVFKCEDLYPEDPLVCSYRLWSKH